MSHHLVAARPEERELFCRNGLKWFAKIPAKKIRAAVKEIQKQRAALRRARPNSAVGKTLVAELDLAARMAEQSCRFMLWQQAVAGGNKAAAEKMRQSGLAELRQLSRDFNRLWPRRNKGTPEKCSPFLRWRLEDYQRGLPKLPPANL